MKRQFLLLIALALFATALATTASGQTSETIRANVKFDFQIGDRIYPAGEYTIDSTNWPDSVLRIKNVNDLHKTAFVLANRLNAGAGNGKTPRLVFQKYGKDYFLTEVFLDTQEWGYSINPSHLQRETERQLQLASRLPRND